MPRFNFELPGTVTESAKLGFDVRAIVLELGFEPKAASQLELCVVEAFNNAAEHACHEDPSKRIRVSLRFEDRVLSVEIRDQGNPMPPDLLSHARMPEPGSDDRTTWSERGRGLPILKSLMDEVSYESRNGVNVLAMKKRLPAAA